MGRDADGNRNRYREKEGEGLVRGQRPEGGGSGARIRGWKRHVIVTSWGHQPMRAVKEQTDQQSHTKRQGTLRLTECAPRGPQIESQGRYSETQSGQLEAAIVSGQPDCGR